MCPIFQALEKLPSNVVIKIAPELEALLEFGLYYWTYGQFQSTVGQNLFGLKIQVWQFFIIRYIALKILFPYREMSQNARLLPSFWPIFCQNTSQPKCQQCQIFSKFYCNTNYSNLKILYYIFFRMFNVFENLQLAMSALKIANFIVFLRVRVRRNFPVNKSRNLYYFNRKANIPLC